MEKKKRAPNGPIKPTDLRCKIAQMSDEQIAKVVRAHDTLTAAAKELGVSPTTLSKHCTSRRGEDSESFKAYKEKSIKNQNLSRGDRFKRLDKDDERRLEFCVNVSPEERDHVANMDYPVRYNSGKASTGKRPTHERRGGYRRS
jgi:hypothetical protein